MTTELPAPLRVPRGGQGQWAAGHTEPLNPNERFKKDDDGLNVRARIENVYAHAGFDSIDPSDLRGRMRWWGLYTQRRPGIPGGLTATLEPEELDDRHFMLRVRIPGGQLSSAQLRVVAGIAQRYGRDLADVTDRQNIQYHWVRIEDVPAIWQELEGVGLSTTEACGDTPRNMLGCPLAGVDAGELFDATPYLLATNARFEGDPAFSNLPRKFKTSISACPSHCTAHEVHDIAFVGVRHPETGATGFDLWVGGGLSTNPMIGKRLGVFVPPDRIEEVWAGVISIFRDWGYRRSRTRARIKFLMADWGPARFRAVLEADYLPGGPLADGPPPAPAAGGRDHVGVTRQHDGRFALGAAPTVGRLSGTTLLAVADLADELGDGRVRLTAEQKLVVLGIAEADVEPAVVRLADLGLRVRTSSFRRGTMACTGIEFCKLALTDTKTRAGILIDELERRLPEFSESFAINVNGCPNACARFQVADLGLKGSIVTRATGERVEGFQVHLGGHLTDADGDAALGRKVRGLKVAADDLADYAEGLIRRWLSHREPGESFAAWSGRADAALLTEGATALAGGRDADD